MARKKRKKKTAGKRRLNRKVVIPLMIVGALLLAGGVVAIINPKNVRTRLIRKLFPKDPDVLLAQAEGLEHQALPKADEADKLAREKATDDGKPDDDDERVVELRAEANRLFAQANRAFKAAVNASQKNPAKHIKMLLRHAESLDTWRRRDKGLSAEMQYRLTGLRLEQLRAVMRLDGRNEEAQKLLTESAWDEAEDRPREKIWQIFLDEVAKHFKVFPKDAEAYYRAARAHAALAKAQPKEHVGAAREAYGQAIELAPKEIEYYIAFAAFLIQQDKRLAAIEVYDRGLAANPKSVEMQVTYAQSLLSWGEPKQADEHFSAAAAMTAETFGDHLAMGRYHLRSQGDQAADYDAAEEAFTKASKLDPADFRPYMSRSRINAMRGGGPAAKRECRDGIEQIESLRGEKAILEMGSKDRRLYLSGLINLHGQLAGLMLDDLPRPPENREAPLAEAKQSIELVTRYAGRSILAAKLRGRLALVEDRLTDAEKALRPIYDSTMRDRPTALLLGQTYLRLRQYGVAAEIVTWLEREFPKDARTLLQSASLSLHLRRLEQAERILARLAALPPPDSMRAQVVLLMREAQRLRGVDPGDMTLPGRIPTKALPGLLREARMLIASRKPNQAAAIYQAILKQHPTSEATVENYVSLLVAARKPDEAKTLLAEARRLMPESKRFERMARLLNATPEEREKQRLAMIEESPDGAAKELTLAGYYLGKRNLDAYRKHLVAAVAIDPTSLAAVEALFREHVRVRDLDAAAKLAETAKKGNLDTVGGRLYTARIALARRDWDAAAALAKEALGLRRRFSTAHALLGQAYVGRGDLQRAKASYTTSYNQNPTNVTAMVGLAGVAELEGNEAEYARWLEEAYKYAPEHRFVRMRRMRHREMKADTKELLLECQARYRRYPNDESNLLMYARLLERVWPPKLGQAENIYRQLHAYGQGKKASLRYLKLLVGFLHRTGRGMDGLALLDAALATEADKVGMLQLYGGYLAIMNRREEAKAVFTKAIETDPTDPRGYEGMAIWASKGKLWDEAIRQMKRSTELKPGRRAAEISLIRLLLNADRIGEAGERINALLQQNPSDAVALAFRGRAEQLAGKNKEATATYLDAIARNRLQVLAPLWLTEIRVADGQIDLAIQELTQCFEMTMSPDVAVRLSGLLTRDRQDKGARERAKTILRDGLRVHSLNPSLMSALASLSLIDGEWPDVQDLLDRGRSVAPSLTIWQRLEEGMWRQRGDPQRQLVVVAQAHADRPTDPGVLLRYLTLLVELGQHDAALSVAGKASAIDVRVAAVISALLGRAHVAKGDEPAGLAAFANAIKLCRGGDVAMVSRHLEKAVGPERAGKLLQQWADSQGTWQGWAALAYYQHEKRRYPQALGAWQTAAKAAKSPMAKVFAIGRLALTQYEMHQYPQAKGSYESALKIHPEDLMSLNNLAYLLANDLKQPKLALPYIQRAEAIKGDDPNVIDTLGWVQFLLKEPVRAEQTLRRSVSMFPTPISRYHLGRVLEAKGDREGALKEYQAGFDLITVGPADSMYEPIKQRLDALRTPAP